MRIFFINSSDVEKDKFQFPLVDLYLIDDRLYKSKSQIYKRGYSIGARIREENPEIPIYLFSEVKDETGIYRNLAQASESMADQILEFKEIQENGHNILFWDAEDYKKIRESEKESIDVLLKLLKAPEEEYDKIKHALPANLKNGLSNITSTNYSAGNSIAFARWIRQTFLELPGFIYNASYSSVKIGLKKDYFLKISSKFNTASYTGIFSRSMKEKKWWDILLKNMIFKLSIKKFPDETDPRKISRNIFKLNKSDIPKCIVCGEEYPDTIGLLKDNEEIEEPVHYRCSISHPKKDRVIYFDEFRQFELHSEDI
jgi:hypothetical protein